MFEYITMGMVLHEELTGYDIKKKIEAGIGNFYKASHGSLYPALKKLTGKGYLSLVEQTQGNRLKKYYKATELGKEVFLEWLSSPYDMKTGDEVHLAQIYFLAELPTELRIKRLQEHEFYLQQMLQELQTIEKQLPTENLSDRDYFELSTFYFSYQLLQNTLRWLGYIREQKPLSNFMSGICEMED